MSYENSKWINLSEKQGVFSGGYVDNVSSLYLANHYSDYCRNVRLDGQSVTIRPGHTLLATLTTGDYPRGIGSYLRTVSSNDRLIVRHNTDSTHKLYTITEAGVATSISTSSDIADDARMTFLNIGDNIYCMNGVDDYGKLAGTTYTTPATGITNFSPSFAVDFSSSGWASGWSDNPTLVYKSVADDYEDYNSAGSDTFTFEETVTGLSENNKTLLVFTPNTISSVDLGDFDQTNGLLTYKTAGLQVSEGSVNHASIVTVGMNTYFVSPSNTINRIRRGFDIDGFEVEELSERKYTGITNLMDTLDADQTDCFSYYLPDKKLIKWFFKTEAASFNDICIIYDITKDAFLVDEQKYFYAGVSFKGKDYTVSTIEPKVYRDEYSQTDEGTAINFIYETKDFYIADPTFKKVLWEARALVFINELASLTQTILADGGSIDVKVVDKDNISASLGGLGTDEIGDFMIGEGGDDEDEKLQEVIILRTKGNLNVIGKKFRVRYECSSIAAKLRLEDVDMRVEQKPSLATNLTT